MYVCESEKWRNRPGRRHIPVQVLKPPRRRRNVPVTSHTHVVGRTVTGLVGIFGIVGINGRHIDQADGKGARLELVALGEALGAIGVSAEVVKLRHGCNLKKYPV